MKTLQFLLLTALVTVIAACQAPTATGDSTALESRVAALEEKINGMANTSGTADLADLTNRVSTLEAQSSGDVGGMDMGDGEATTGTEHSDEHGEAISVGSQDQVFAVTMALNTMDTAGLHGMDESLNAGETIDPAYAGTIQRLSRIVSVTPWPEELADQAMALRDSFNTLEEALANDDAAAAAPLATEVHDAEHELSHAAGTWINAQLGIEGEGEHAD